MRADIAELVFPVFRLGIQVIEGLAREWAIGSSRRLKRSCSPCSRARCPILCGRK